MIDFKWIKFLLKLAVQVRYYWVSHKAIIKNLRLSTYEPIRYIDFGIKYANESISNMVFIDNELSGSIVRLERIHKILNSIMELTFRLTVSIITYKFIHLFNLVSLNCMINKLVLDIKNVLNILLNILHRGINI